MIWGLTLYPTVIGYLFLRQWNYTRFEIPLDSGYHVLFKSIIAGMLLFAIPYLTATGFTHFCPEFFPLKVWQTFVPYDFAGTLVMVFLEALSGAWLLNRTPWFNADTCLRRTIRVRGDIVGNLIFDTATSREFVEISLKNSKSYIGIPIYWNNAAGKHVELVPYWSGYRQEVTQQLTITTDYSHVVAEQREKDVRLVIPLSEIISARPFSQSLYREFQETATLP